MAAVNKKQNRVSEFRRNLLAWRDAGVFTDVAYIIGFSDDTPESIRRDVAILHRDLPMERLEFSVMNPSAGISGPQGDVSARRIHGSGPE